MNAVRLLGDEKQGYAGFGFGSFGQNFGFGLSVGWRYFEKLEVGVFGGMALDVTGADEIEAEGYESPKVIHTPLSVSITCSKSRLSRCVAQALYPGQCLFGRIKCLNA